MKPSPKSIAYVRFAPADADMSTTTSLKPTMASRAPVLSALTSIATIGGPLPPGVGAGGVGDGGGAGFEPPQAARTTSSTTLSECLRMRPSVEVDGEGHAGADRSGRSRGARCRRCGRMGPAAAGEQECDGGGQTGPAHRGLQEPLQYSARC